MNIQFRAPETERKLLLLAATYKERVGRDAFPQSVRAQHKHMFGLTVLEDLGVNAQSVTRSRSGLIITETMLGFLDIDGISERAFSKIVADRVKIADWSDHVYREWVSPAKGATVGKWWISPVLEGLLEHPSSSVRSVILGLEAMNAIERRLAEHQRSPKSRARAVRLTGFGKELLENFKQGQSLDAGVEK